MQFLAKQLIDGHSCSPEEHTAFQDGLEADLESYVEAQAADDIILEYTNMSLKSLSEDTIMHISNSHNVLDMNANIKGTEPIHRFLDPDTNDKEFVVLPSTICQQLFEGTRWERGRDGLQKCFTTLLMHQSYNMTQKRQRIARDSHISYDVDSFLALPTSLSVAKRGIKV